jgi:hypothetical protein
MAFTRHVGEDLPLRRIVDVVHIQHASQIGSPGGRLARLDTRQRRSGHPELLGYLFQLDGLRFAQAP